MCRRIYFYFVVGLEVLVVVQLEVEAAVTLPNHGRLANFNMTRRRDKGNQSTIMRCNGTHRWRLSVGTAGWSCSRPSCGPDLTSTTAALSKETGEQSLTRQAKYIDGRPFSKGTGRLS